MVHIIFLVHGTWGEDQNGWYQIKSKSSSFPKRLITALKKKGLDEKDIIIKPFEWSGGNTHSDRIAAAKSLSSTIKNLRKKYLEIKVHFVAHSHGGNVVLKALEFYLHNLAWMNTPDSCDFYDGDEPCEKLLSDCKSGKYQNLVITKALQKDIDELSFLVESDGAIENHVFSFRRRRQLMANIYTHIYSTSDMHLIDIVVTLVTPFYEKHWIRTKWVKIKYKLSQHATEFIQMSFFLYPIILIIFGSLSFTPWMPWIGLNPLNWQLWPLMAWSVLTLYLVKSYPSTNIFELPVDTNIYFDEAELPLLLHTLESNKLFRVLNIHSGYLDEAYCLLSAYPFLSKKITNHFNFKFRPQFWTYNSPELDIGLWRGSVMGRVNRIQKIIARLNLSIINAVLYPLYFIGKKIAFFQINKLLQEQMRMLAMGLPMEEANTKSEVTVEKTLHKKFCETEVFDITEELANQKFINEDYKGRFEFLWNENELNERIKTSLFTNKTEDHENIDQKKQLIAIEERAKEFFGIVGLKHSMYYDNEAVVKKVANFIAKKAY